MLPSKKVQLLSLAGELSPVNTGANVGSAINLNGGNMNRRQAISAFAQAGGASLLASTSSPASALALVIVKIETTEPGLVGWGCATFTQRALVVKTAIEEYLKPFLTGRNVDEIEDIWQSNYVSSYWRNGPVLFNAMSGVDIGLWDIKAKRAGMPLYQLLGGKVRHGADCYF